MGRHEWGLDWNLLYQSMLYLINFLRLEDGFFSFLSEKGLFLIPVIPVKRNTAFCVLCCAVLRKMASMFVTFNLQLLCPFPSILIKPGVAVQGASCQFISNKLTSWVSMKEARFLKSTKTVGHPLIIKNGILMIISTVMRMKLDEVQDKKSTNKLLQR